MPRSGPVPNHLVQVAADACDRLAAMMTALRVSPTTPDTLLATRRITTSETSPREGAPAPALKIQSLTPNVTA
jgi:hypothetical protein